MPYQFAMVAATALLVEYPEMASYLSEVWIGFNVVFFIVLTCVAAIAVNILTYALIGKTSAVTFQVVGHLKTVLTLTVGAYAFAAIPTQITVVGILIALVGMVVYSSTKTPDKPSVLQMYFHSKLWLKEY